MASCTSDSALLRLLASNDQLERPTAVSARALCVHNSPSAHSAPYQLSRPLQALVRCPAPCWPQRQCRPNAIPHAQKARDIFLSGTIRGIIQIHGFYGAAARELNL